MRAFEFLTEVINLSGWTGSWLTDTGEEIQVDPQNGFHHWVAAENKFGKYLTDKYYDKNGDLSDEGEWHVVDIAKKHGWVRLYDRSDQRNDFGAEYNYLTDRNKKILLRILSRKRDKEQIFINKASYNNINDAQKVIRNESI